MLVIQYLTRSCTAMVLYCVCYQFIQKYFLQKVAYWNPNIITIDRNTTKRRVLETIISYSPYYFSSKHFHCLKKFSALIFGLRESYNYDMRWNLCVRYWKNYFHLDLCCLGQFYWPVIFSEVSSTSSFEILLTLNKLLGYMVPISNLYAV